MKKIFVILSVAVASVAVADDYAYLRELVELKQRVENVSVLKEQSEQIKLQKEISVFARFALEKMFVQNPSVFATSTQCFPHTYIWYRWQDYDRANVIGKVGILQEIEKLTKE